MPPQRVVELVVITGSMVELVEMVAGLEPMIVM
jgi:hypothetical protein